MKFIPVTSSNIDSVAYVATKKVLQVKFKNGSWYEYHAVPESTFVEFIGASSVGGYFSKNIARGFSYFKVENPTCSGCQHFVFEGTIEAGEAGVASSKCLKYDKPLPVKLLRLEVCEEPFFPING